MPLIMKNFLIILIAILLLPFISSGQSAIYSAKNIHHPVIGQKGMVATQHIDATKVGLEILKKGRQCRQL